MKKGPAPNKPAEKKGATKKDATKKDSKKSQGKQVTQPKQEEKKSNQSKPAEEQKAQSKDTQQKKMPITEIKLQALVDTVEGIKKRNKTALIVDPTGNAFTFYKYKGTIIDLSEYILQEQMQKQKREESIEKTRKQLYLVLKSGSTGVLFLDKMLNSLKEYFKDAKFYQPENIYVPSNLLKEEYYKKSLLIPEEDVDIDGNKGCFLAKQDSQLCILVNQPGEDIAKLMVNLGLDQIYFEVVKILQN